MMYKGNEQRIHSIIYFHNSNKTSNKDHQQHGNTHNTYINSINGYGQGKTQAGTYVYVSITISHGLQPFSP